MDQVTMQKEIDALKKQCETTHDALIIAVDSLHKLGTSFVHVDEIFQQVSETFRQVKAKMKEGK